MSVIGGQNTPSTNGLAYIIDFNNNYTSGSSIVNPILYLPTSSQFTGSVPNLINGQIQFATGSVLRSFQNFPGFNPNTGNLTIMFSGEVKNNAVLFTQDGQMAVVGTTSSIGYGVPAGNVGRNFPNTGFDHVTLRFSTASVDCFINGVPVSASGIFPTVPSSSVNTDFKIGGNFISAWTGSLSGSLGQLMVYTRPLSDDEIYSNYLIQARRYGLPEIAKPYTVDSSVYVYTQAAGITDTVTLNALNTFVQGLKSASLWDKMVAIYPFIGTNPSASRLNLKDVSLNTTQVNYSGSWSTSLSGSRNNNTASYGILSNVKGTYVHPLINSQSIHLSYLSYDTPTSGGYLMGVEQIPGLPGDIAQPAAAYSVRKVRTAYTGSAMTVRRDFDDVTFDVGFDTQGNLNTGSLLTNMTASGLTTTLPGDYSGLAAAYSLRRVSSSYTGSAIEVRRDWDNATGSIGFDSFGNLNTASLLTFVGYENLLLYSQDLSNGYWIKDPGILIATDTASAPDGTMTADKVYNIASNYSIYKGSIPVPTPGTYTFSYYLKAVPGDEGKTIGVGNGSTLLTLSSNWIRYSASISNNFTYEWGTKSGATANQFLLWGIQLNTGSSATIYTQTTSTTSSASTGLKNGFVKTWYDQSGNNRHATQSVDASQPQIVSSGVIVTENGKPSIQFDNTNDSLAVPNSNAFYFDNKFYITHVNSFTTYNDYDVVLNTADDGGGSNGWWLEYGFNRGFTLYDKGVLRLEDNVQSIQSLSTGTNRVFTILQDSNGMQGYYNNILFGTSSYTGTLGSVNKSLDISSIRNTSYFSNMKIQEIIIYPSDQSSRRGLISDNINGYYNIFTQSLASGSGYVTRWYDQSGNNRHATQSVAANQFLILSSGSLITENGKPAIKYLPSSSYYSTGLVLNNASMSFYIATRHFFETVGGIGRQGGIIGAAESTSDFNYNNFAADGAWYFGNGSANSSINTTLVPSQSYIASGLARAANDRELLINGQSVGSSTTSRQVNFTLAFPPRYRPMTEYGVNEIIIYPTGHSRQLGLTITQNINNYFNTYYQPYNLNTNSLSLFSSPTTVAGAANAVASGLTTGGPLGLITVSRTGSSNYTLWKNRVPTVVTATPSTASSSEIYLNTANVNNSLFSGSQNNIAYASVGAGLTDNEAATYYDLVDTLQTNLRRVKSSNPNAFITTWDTRITGTGTISNTSSIVLPLFGTQAITASWGDGTTSLISQSTQVDRTHSYATPGIYTVSITGQGQGFQFNNGGDRAKLMDIVQWGSISGSTTSGFYGCTNLVGTSPDSHVLETTSLASYFRATSRFNGAIGNWNTSNISDMLYTFGDAVAFNQPIGNWNTSNVTRMSNTFLYASSFNQNLGNWDVSKVTEMARMFDSSPFNNGGSNSINNWRPVSCSDFNSMFQSNTAFNQPIGNWTIGTGSHIPSTGINMSNMFRSSNFNQNIGAWNVEKVTNMSSMFRDNGGFNNSGSSDINNWRPISCSNFSSMFQSATAFNQPIGNWPLSASGISMANMFNGATAFNQNIGSWDVSRVTGNTTTTGFYRMFYNATAFNNSGSNTINNWRFTTSSTVTMAGMFSGTNTATSTKFNQNIGSWNVEKVTDMSSMFEYNNIFNNSGSSDINNWRPISCSNFSRMFSSATSFNQPIGNWPLSASNIDMSLMFDNATAFNQPIGSWDTSRVTSLFQTFINATNFNQDIGSWNVGNVTSLVNTFRSSGFNNGGSPSINNWNTSNVTNMSLTFAENNAFNQPIGGWNVGKVTTFDLFFYGKTVYSHLHTIYDGWINYKLQPNRTINFSTINYSASAAEGKALLERPYVTQSINNIQDSASFINIVTLAPHNLTPNNKVFIFGVSGSISGSVNGLRTVLSTGSNTEFTLSGSLWNPAQTYDVNTGTVITGYGWNITDGNPV
jgi:surface protein